MRKQPLAGLVVGAGLMGRWHAATLRALGVPLTAVVDRDDGRGRALCGGAGTPWFSDLEEALAAVPCDVVHVCTDLPSHVPLASLALASGRHVLVEKPLAPSATETERLLGEARAAGRLLCPVHQLLFQRGVQRVLSRLPSRAAVRHVDVVACSAGAEGRTGADRTEVALEILPHALALVARLLPDAAAAVAWQVASSPGELRLTAQVGQTSAGILISMSGRPTRNSLRVITDRGTRHLDLFHGFSVAERAWTSRAYKVARPFALALGTWSVGGANLLARTARREWAYPGLRELVRAFYRAAGGDGPPPIPEHETLLVGRWWDRIVHAVRTEHDSVAGA